MPPSSLSLLRSLSSLSILLSRPTLHPSTTKTITPFSLSLPSLPSKPLSCNFTTTPQSLMTLNQVRRGGRTPRRARRAVSPALRNRPEMKGVCLKVGITKPKKPNSGERKTARVRLSNGRAITAYISGEGEAFVSLNCHFGGNATVRIAAVAA